MEAKEIRVRFVPDTKYLESLKEAAIATASAVQGLIEAIKALPENVRVEKTQLGEALTGDKESFKDLAHMTAQEINRQSSQRA